MAAFFLKTEEYECLKNLYLHIDLADENDEKLLRDSSIVVVDENGNRRLDKYKISVLRTCFLSKIYMLVDKNSMEEEYYYYLYNDQIVYVEKKRDGYTFMNLPNIKYAIGSIADLFWDDIIQIENEQHEISCLEKIDNNNYLFVLNKLFANTEYQLNKINLDKKEIVFTGIIDSNEVDFLILIRILDEECHYYKCETDSVKYGKIDRTGLVNLISNWMLYRHKELIETMIGEE